MCKSINVHVANNSQVEVSNGGQKEAKKFSMLTA